MVVLDINKLQQKGIKPKDFYNAINPQSYPQPQSTQAQDLPTQRQ